MIMTLDQWLKVGQIIAALAIGVSAVAVSVQQLKIAKSKQRLELYDRRLLTLQTTQSYLNKILNSNEFSSQDVVDFQKSTSEAKFLFDADVNEQLKWLIKVGLQIDVYNFYLQEMRSGANIPYAPKNTARERAALLISVNRKYDAILNMFARYMDMKG